MTDRPHSTEEALESYLNLRRRGERIGAAEFARRHPHLGAELVDALEALELLEGLGGSPNPDDVDLPDRVGSFRVVREIGRGGMGIVLEAIEEPLGRRVALKILPAEMIASPAARARFRREAELAARLDHSGIATVFTTGIEGDRPWIAMKYVEGVTLARAITTARDTNQPCAQLPGSRGDAVSAVVACAAQVARALHAAHEQGIVHRDVKPSNVIVTPEGVPVLVDFGLAIPRESEGMTVTRTGETAGTPAYIAPEIVGGSRDRPDAQVDVYALGVTLYECLTLRRPFDGPTPVALYRSILSDTPTAVHAVLSEAPRDLSVVVATAMERDRSRRYATAAAFAADLEAVVAGRPIAARPLPTHERVLRWMRREPKQAVLAGVLVVVSVALASFAGNWWASRGEVLAAERVVRSQECEAALTEGFAQLLETGSGDASFVSADRLDPGNLEALGGRVLAALDQGRTDGARALLEQGPATAGFEALRDRARGLRVTRDRTLLSSTQAGYLDYFLVGMALEDEARDLSLSDAALVHRRALAMLDEAVVRSSRAREFVHLRRANLAVTVGDADVARSAAGSLLTLWPESFHAVCTAGIALGELDAATGRDLLWKAAGMRPHDPAVWYDLATLAFREGEFDQAELYARNSIRCKILAENQILLGNTYAVRGCFEEARAVYHRILSANPDHENALLNDAQAASESRDVDTAVLELEQVLRLDPWNGVAHGVLGMILRERKDREGARLHTSAAVALMPERADLWSELVWLEGLLDNWAYAQECVEAGLERHPGDEKLLEFRTRIERIRANPPKSKSPQKSKPK